MTSRRNLISLDLDDLDDDGPLLPETKIGFDREDLAPEGQGGHGDQATENSVSEDASINVSDSKKSVFDLSDVDEGPLQLSKAVQQRLRASAKEDGFRDSRPKQYGRPQSGRTSAIHVRVRPEIAKLIADYRSNTGVGVNIAVEQAVCSLLNLDFATLKPISNRGPKGD